MNSVPLTDYIDIPEVDGFYYVGAPYGDENPAVIAQRMEEYLKADAWLTTIAHFTFSPLDKHHQLKYSRLPGTYKFWQRYCHEMMRLAKGLIIITLPGWETSVGVTDEIRLATELGLPIYYVEPKS